MEAKIDDCEPTADQPIAADAASGLLVTVHPQMLDVASMSQFLFMTSDLLSVVRESGGTL